MLGNGRGALHPSQAALILARTGRPVSERRIRQLLRASELGWDLLEARRRILARNAAARGNLELQIHYYQSGIVSKGCAATLRHLPE